MDKTLRDILLGGILSNTVSTSSLPSSVTMVKYIDVFLIMNFTLAQNPKLYPWKMRRFCGQIYV